MSKGRLTSLASWKSPELLQSHLCCFRRDLWGWCIPRCSRRTQKGAARRLPTAACWACPQRAFCLLKEEGCHDQGVTDAFRWKQISSGMQTNGKIHKLISFLIENNVPKCSLLTLQLTHVENTFSRVFTLWSFCGVVMCDQYLTCSRQKPGISLQGTMERCSCRKPQTSKSQLQFDTLLCCEFLHCIIFVADSLGVFGTQKSQFGTFLVWLHWKK